MWFRGRYENVSVWSSKIVTYPITLRSRYGFTVGSICSETDFTNDTMLSFRLGCRSWVCDITNSNMRVSRGPDVYVFMIGGY